MTDSITQTEEFQAAVKEAVDEQVAGLKSKNQELLGKQKDLRDQLAKFDGVDPERFRALLEADEKRQAKNAKDRGDWEKREEQIRTQLTTEYDKVVNGLKEENAALQRDVDQYLVGDQVTKAIADAKGNPRLLEPHVRQRVKVDVVDGRRQAVVLDEAGQGRALKPNAKSTTEFMSIGDLVESFRADKAFAGAFEGSGGSGGGAPPRTGGDGPAKPQSDATYMI